MANLKTIFLNLFNRNKGKQQKLLNVGDENSIDFIQSLKESVLFQISTEKEFYEFIEKIKTGEISTHSILSKISNDSGLLERKDIILAALELYGLDLQYVIGILRTDPQVIETAINQNALAIEYIENPTDEQIKMVITRNSIALKYKNIDSFKENPNNRDFLLSVISEHGKSIEYLPIYQNDNEFILKATENNPEAIQFAGKNISNDIILSSIAKLQQNYNEVLTDRRKKYNDPFQFWNIYHNMKMFLSGMVSDLKSKYPERFDDLEFMTDLCNIDPIFLKLAPPSVKQDENFSNKFGEYHELGPFDAFSMYSDDSTNHPTNFTKKQENTSDEPTLE